MIECVFVDDLIKCSLAVTDLFPIYSCAETNVPDSIISSLCQNNRLNTHIHFMACWTENCTPQVSSQHETINRCWLGLLSTFVLHGKQQPLFCVPVNQYSDLRLGWAAQLAEQMKKREANTNWLWNENEKAPAHGRWQNENKIAGPSFPEYELSWMCAQKQTSEEIVSLTRYHVCLEHRALRIIRKFSEHTAAQLLCSKRSWPVWQVSSISITWLGKYFAQRHLKNNWERIHAACGYLLTLRLTLTLRESTPKTSIGRKTGKLFNIEGPAECAH